MQPLEGVTVLDLTQHIAGPYATKLFADFGADVIKVERPGGDPARQLGPFQGDEAHPEKSGLFFFLNTNKRSVELDLTSENGREALRALARRADLAVESFSPGTLDDLGCGWDVLHETNPVMPLVSLSNFGQTGPYRDYKVSDLVLYAFAGEMYTLGQPDREPTKLAGSAALFESGSSAAVAAFGALWAARHNKVGQHVDVSMAETHFGGVDRRHAFAAAFQYAGRKGTRAGGGGGGLPSGTYPCADGYVEFQSAQVRPDRVSDMLGHPDWLTTDPRFSDPVLRTDPDTVEAFTGHFLLWCMEHTKREIWAEARRAKVMCGPLFSTEDLFADEHFRDRGFWAEAEHQALGKVTFPGRPFTLSAGGWEMRQPAPLLGEHTEEVLAEAGVSRDAITALTAGGGA